MWCQNTFMAWCKLYRYSITLPPSPTTDWLKYSHFLGLQVMGWLVCEGSEGPASLTALTRNS